MWPAGRGPDSLSASCQRSGSVWCTPWLEGARASPEGSRAGFFMPERRNPVRKTTQKDRSTAGQIAALTRWSRVDDRAEATKPAREGLRRKFEQQVDPDRTLPVAEREYRVNQLMKAHMLRMTLAAKRARAARRATTGGGQIGATAGGDAA